MKFHCAQKKLWETTKAELSLAYFAMLQPQSTSRSSIELSGELFVRRVLQSWQVLKEIFLSGMYEWKKIFLSSGANFLIWHQIFIRNLIIRKFARYVLRVYLQQEFVHYAIVRVMQRGWRFRRWKNSGTSTSYFCSARRSSMRQDVLRFAISHARFFFSLLFLSVWRGCLRFRLEVQKDCLIAYTLMNNIAAAFPARLNHDLL